jgi:hypothetical protein
MDYRYPVFIFNERDDLFGYCGFGFYSIIETLPNSSELIPAKNFPQIFPD